MADERHRGALSAHSTVDPATTREQQLLAIAEQELSHLSSVEPRTGFESRLRAAVYQARFASARRPMWFWPAMGAAATVVLAFVLFMAIRPTREVAAVADAPAVSLPADVPGPAQLPVPEVAPAVTLATESKVASAPHRSVAHRRSVEPEVLIPPGEARALIEWVAQVNRERRVPALLASADAAVDQKSTFTNIEIQPIEIVPLEPAMSSGT